MNFVELFCGIGGFRLGLEKADKNLSRITKRQIQDRDGKRCARPGCENGAGEKQRSLYRCVWANDNYKYACQVYRKNFGSQELVEGDIQDIPARDIPDHTLLTAGFPCQAFSIAGRRAGFQDSRGKRIFEVARIIQAKRPPLILLENVRGLLSVQRGYCFYRILQTLDELGYDVEWQVLNSKCFGVPQSRPRVFIVGRLRGSGGREIFPVGESHKVDVREGKQKIKCFHDSGAEIQRIYNTDGITPCLPIRKTGGWQGTKIAIKKVTLGHFQKTVYSPEGISPTLREGHGDVVRIVQTPKTSYALDATYWKGTNVQRYFEKHRRQLVFPCGTYRARRLTPTECERLQGFPDGWTEGVSDRQRYILLGNAVTVNVIEFLGSLLMLSRRKRGD